MKRSTWISAAALAAAFVFGLAIQSTPAGTIYDQFNSIDPSWVTDRYAPADFSIVADPLNVSNNVLNIGISTNDSSPNRPPSYSSTFYNTQGKQRPVNIGPSWTLSADLFVPSGINTTTGSLMRTDLWGRDSNPVENNAYYPIIGITNASSTDPLNPSAGDRSVRFQAWNSNTGWQNLGLPGSFQFDQWHNLSITYNGSSFIYRIDGNSVYTETPASALAFGNLQTAYLQAYNFGDSNYSVQWDNLSAVVPLPAAAWAGLVLLGSMGGVGGIKRLRRQHA